MKRKDYDSLSQAINGLTEDGYTEGFKATDSYILGTKSKKEYQPQELKVVQTYRFEGMTNPQDSSILLAIQADDGINGTLVMSYSYDHNQNTELIKAIPKVKREKQS